MEEKDKKIGELRFRKVRPVHKVENFEQYLKEAFETSYGQVEEKRWKIFALLFARPANQLAKNEIIPMLDFLHYHTKDFIDFYCVGYQKLGKEHNKSILVEVGENRWTYDNLTFVKLLRLFEEETKWKYSGRSDMIIANYSFFGNTLHIDYSNAINLNLEKAQACKAINSVEEFFTSISNFAASQDGKNPTFDLIKKQHLKLGKKAIWNMILSLLPEQIRNTPEQIETFLMEDLSK